MAKKNKPFYLDKPSKDEVAFIRYLAKMYRVKLFLSVQKTRSYVQEDAELCKAYSLSFKSEIYLDFKNIQTIKELFICFFHELQHCINFRENKFINFHKQPKSVGDIHRKTSLTLRAEQYTDMRAEKLQKLYAPMVPYEGAYHHESVKEIVRFENQISKLMMIVNQSYPQE